MNINTFFQIKIIVYMYISLIYRIEVLYMLIPVGTLSTVHSTLCHYLYQKHTQDFNIGGRSRGIAPKMLFSHALQTLTNLGKHLS